MSPEQAVAASVRDLAELTVVDDPSAARSTLARWVGDPERITRLAWAFSSGPEAVAGACAQLCLVRGLGGLARDLHAAVKKRAKELDREKEATSVSRPRSPGRPAILVKQQLDTVLDAAWAARLNANEPPSLFQSHGVLVRRVGAGVDTRLQLLNVHSLIEEISRCADWVREGREGGYVDMQPPKQVAECMLATPHPSLPPIRRIAHAPFVAADGAVVCDPGLHRPTETWVELPDHLRFDGGPELLTRADAEAAAAFLTAELFSDFSFVDASDRAHALGMFLTPIVRPMFEGPTPIQLISAPARGVGKTLLVRLPLLLFLGQEPALTTMPEDDDEVRKKITALLSTGMPFIAFDNVDRALRSPTLAGMATAPVWSDRLLGASQMTSIRNDVLWVFTGQNPPMSDEITRRVVEIRLQPIVATSWSRPASDFRHPDIAVWTREHRVELIRALLVMVRWWHQQGQPHGLRVRGSFEPWSKIVGGILHAAGVEGFLDDASRLKDRMMTGTWDPLLAWWAEHLAQRPLTCLQLLQQAREAGVIENPLQPDPQEANKLGKHLKKMERNVIGPCRLEKQGQDRKGTTLWVMEPLTAPVASGPSKTGAAIRSAEEVPGTEHPRHTPGSIPGSERQPDTYANGDLPGMPGTLPTLRVRNEKREKEEIHSFDEHTGETPAASQAPPAHQPQQRLNADFGVPGTLPGMPGTPSSPASEQRWLTEVLEPALRLGWPEAFLAENTWLQQEVAGGAVVLEVRTTHLKLRAPRTGRETTVRHPDHLYSGGAQ